MTKQPNILFLFPDSHRGDWMPYDDDTLEQLGMGPIGLRMPNIQQLMDEGVTFTRAITSSPLCAPARACLAAGVRYDSCGTFSNSFDYPLDKPTYYSVLKNSGYSVGAVGKLDLHKPTQWWGLDGWIEELGTLGFTAAIDNAGKIDAIVSGKEEPKDPYMNYLYKQGLAHIHLKDMTSRRGEGATFPTELPEEAYCDNWLSNNGLELIRSFPENQPWFLMVNFTGPHGPWDITKRMKKEWETMPLPLPNQGKEELREQILEVRQNYAAMLENIDRNIGLLIDEIRSRGELDQTIIVYSSDHGEMLGDFQKFGKCSPYRGSVHIPLVIKGPGVQQGVRSDALVELQDLAATFTEFAGQRMESAIDSYSLKPLLTGEATEHRECQVSELKRYNNKYPDDDWKMISDGRYKLNVWENKPTELFDLQTDPWENHNIASDNTEIIQTLTAKAANSRGGNSR